jgi:hypothetical protein
VTRIRLEIDISNTLGTDAWDNLRHYEEVSGGRFGPDEGTGGACRHSPEEPHRSGEWFGAIVLLQNHLLAEYAVAHYLEQPRVNDAYIDGTE